MVGRPQISCLLTQMSWETTDFLSAETTDVSPAAATDVLFADTPDVLSTDKELINLHPQLRQARQA